MSDYTILHCFADEGVESETLANYGTVVRVGIDPTDKNDSRPIKADAEHLPIRPGVTFDLGVYHPPCTPWCDMPGADTENAPNLIPTARKIAKEHCKHYIIENKPRAPLEDPVRLTGHMFGLPIAWERAFETSFSVEQPPNQRKLSETETSPFFYSNRSKAWWAAVKGCSTRYGKQHIAKNTIPAAYLNYLLQYWAKARDNRDTAGYVDREKYADYDKEMDARRAKAVNEELSKYE